MTITATTILVPLLTAFTLIAGAVARLVWTHDDDELLDRLAAGMPADVPEADEVDLFVTMLVAWRNEAQPTEADLRRMAAATVPDLQRP